MIKELTIVCIKEFISCTYIPDNIKVYNPGDKINVYQEYMYEDGENSIIDDNYFKDGDIYLPNNNEYFITLKDYREQQLNQLVD